MLQTIAPEPSTDPRCRGRHTPSKRLVLAEPLCGAQLTARRWRTLVLLWERSRPIEAYELTEALGRRNAYVPHLHRERRQTSMFLVCSRSRRSAEQEDRRVEHVLGEDATAIGFRISRPVIELEGVCLHCREAGGVA